MAAQLVPEGSGFAVLEAGDVFDVSEIRATKETYQGVEAHQIYLRVSRRGAFIGWAFGTQSMILRLVKCILNIRFILYDLSCVVVHHPSSRTEVCHRFPVQVHFIFPKKFKSLMC